MNFRVLLPAAAAAVVASCSTVDRLNRPLGDSATNPLNAPGSGRAAQQAPGAAPSFTPGQFVKAVMDNTAFFSKRPSGSADADKLLKVNTPMKVVEDDGSYVKVELDGGQVGYVPSVMLFDPNAPAAGLPGAPGDIQSIPPAPAPPLPTGTSGDAVPIVAPTDAPPADAVPAVVDPAAAPAAAPSGTPPGPPPGAPAATEEKKP